jgi:hypothetical protein
VLHVRTSAAADVRLGDLRDAEVMPHPCQMGGAPEPPRGH